MLLENLGQALSMIFTLEVFTFMIIGTTLGIMLGAIPGLGVGIGMAVLLPLTFGLPPVPALLLLVSLYKGTLLGGSISAILLNTPGTEAAAATVIDGYPLAQRGFSRKAIQGAIYSSGFADIFSDIVLIVCAVALAPVVLRFGPPETFWIMVFALVATSSLAGPSVWKGILAMSVGLLLGTIGLDPVLATPRLGVIPALGRMESLDLVAVLLGIFAFSEILRRVVTTRSRRKQSDPEEEASSGKRFKLGGPSISFAEIRNCLKAFIISTGIGTIIGIIPGMGTTAGAYLGYGISKQSYRGKSITGKFGEGALPGVVAAEAGNNAVSGANLVPLITLGIPGNAVAAVILAALLLQGISPGPGIFQAHGPIIYALFVGFIIANILNILIANLLLIPIIRILKVDASILFPIVTLVCFIGLYSVNHRLLDLGVMVAIGVLAFLLRRGGVPIAPMAISFILARTIEVSFRTSLAISVGDFGIFLMSPLSKALIVLCVLALTSIIILRKKGGVI